ncbi:MAG: Outer rane efflux protein [Chthoniobacteraceae bacterium]|nr:Outer rane efflux protein [Chthoniobacteraceae bacterium]
MKLRLLIYPLLACALGGCTANFFRRSADRETGRIIGQKGSKVENMDPKFSIASNGPVSLAGLPLNKKVEASLGEDAPNEAGLPVISLETALGMAIKHSRIYQNNKEQVYLSALSLTLSRHQFTPLFSIGGAGRYNVRTVPGEGPSLSDNLVENRQYGGNGEASADWLIRGVGKISAAFTTDALRFIGGDARLATSSQLGATFTRPLLRDSGFKSDTESLLQAEREVLYEVRSFVKFRKDFSVQLASAYYGVLGNRDAIRNSYLSLQSSRKAIERGRALAKEGRVTQADLGRLEQQALSSESAWISAVRTYKRALDDFKIQLGIPVPTRLMLDDHDLDQLKIEPPDISPDDALKIALAARLDFQNVRDQRADAVRKVKLAKDRFKPQLDIVGGIGADSAIQSQGFATPDAARYKWNGGVNVDLPFLRKAERNSYRAALISLDRAGRAEEQRRDEIELQVRDSFRTLEQARRSYELSEGGVKLAERRVEEQELLAQLGRAKAQDQVDAQNDLVSSKNQRTQALVAHTIARLQFWVNMGILYIKDNGQWRETKHAKPNLPS